jgi:hypothetical protein
MRHWRHVVGMLTLVGLGYALGATQALQIPAVFGQQDAKSGPSDEATKKIQDAYDRMKGAMDTLRQEGLHKPIIKGLNSYAVLAGGIDSERDLEEGKGVDPETFAALYAGDAVDSIAQDLSRDEEGRLTYKNKVVRIYPISRLKKIHHQRQILTGEILPDAQ